MYKSFYINFIIYISFIFAQAGDQDVFFLDMGVVIEPQKGALKTNRLIKKNSNNSFSKKIVKNKAGRPIYMATTSEVFSSLDKINGQVLEIEKDFSSKLLALEIENSRLRNQINSLNQKITSETISLDYNNFLSTKPICESPVPSEINQRSADMIDVDGPSDKMEKFNNEYLVFDKKVYTSGMISYNNEEYYKCIEYLKSLPLNKVNKRTSSNVLFLLAEAYENIGRYKQALNCLNQLAEFGHGKYSELVLVKQGMIYRDIGMKIEAKKLFQNILNDFPNSKYTSLAQEEIKNI
tara:strand:- start:1546 stop:2427 length:882 start_codon:yes stop_codon:yes gene_type:complete